MDCSWITARGGRCIRDGHPSRTEPDLGVALCSQHWAMLTDWADRRSTEGAELALAQAEAAEDRANRVAQDDRLGIVSLKLELQHLVNQARGRVIPPAPSIVYAVQRADGLIKIGTTTKPRLRMRALEAGYGPLDVLIVVDGGYEEEAALHRKFASHLAEGREWFYPAPPVLEWITGQAA